MTTLDVALGVLGLTAPASEREIRKAYARLAKVHRPDVDPETFSQIRQAYDRALEIVAERSATDLIVRKAPALNRHDDRGKLSKVHGQSTTPFTPDRPENKPAFPPHGRESGNDGLRQRPNIRATPSGRLHDSGDQATGDFLILKIRLDQVLLASERDDEDATDEIVDITRRLLSHPDVVPLARRSELLESLIRQALRCHKAPYAFVALVAGELGVIDQVPGRVVPPLHALLRRRYASATLIHDFERSARLLPGRWQSYLRHGAGNRELAGLLVQPEVRRQFNDTMTWLMSLDPPRPDLMHERTVRRWRQMQWIPVPRWYHAIMIFGFMVPLILGFLLVLEQFGVTPPESIMEHAIYGPVLTSSIAAMLAVVAGLLTIGLVTVGTYFLNLLQQQILHRFPIVVCAIEFAWALCVLALWALEMDPTWTTVCYLYAAQLLLMGVTGQLQEIGRIPCAAMIFFVIIFFVLLIPYHAAFAPTIGWSLMLLGALLHGTPLLGSRPAVVHKRIHGDGQVNLRGARLPIPIGVVYRWCAGVACMAAAIALALVSPGSKDSLVIIPLLTFVALVLLYAEVVLNEGQFLMGGGFAVALSMLFALALHRDIVQRPAVTATVAICVVALWRSLVLARHVYLKYKSSTLAT